MTIEGDQTRARLLTTARDLYLQDGFARFSLREVARRSGVSAGAVYRHYEGKEALLREVCVEGFRIFAAYLLRALGPATPRERMMACLEQYLHFAVENPEDYRVIFMGTPADAAAVGPIEKSERAPTFQFLVDRVRECMHARILRKGDLDEVAATIWSHVHGLVSLRLSGHLTRIGGPAEFKRFYRHSAEQLLAGLGHVNTVHKKEKS